MSICTLFTSDVKSQQITDVHLAHPRSPHLDIKLTHFRQLSPSMLQQYHHQTQLVPIVPRRHSIHSPPQPSSYPTTLSHLPCPPPPCQPSRTTVPSPHDERTSHPLIPPRPPPRPPVVPAKAGTSRHKIAPLEGTSHMSHCGTIWPASTNATGVAFWPSLRYKVYATL